MRNGLRSSRGAMRGTIGGTAGLATVAIGFRSFRVRALCATSLDCGRVPCVHVFHLARQQPQSLKLALGGRLPAARFNRSPLISSLQRRSSSADTDRDTESSKNESAAHPDAAESPELQPHAPRKPDHAPAAAMLQPRFALSKSPVRTGSPTRLSPWRLA